MGRNPRIAGKRRRWVIPLAVASFALALMVLAHFAVEHAVSQMPEGLQDLTGDPKRGAYVVRLAGCVACHTDSENGGPVLAGGRRLDTVH